MCCAFRSWECRGEHIMLQKQLQDVSRSSHSRCAIAMQATLTLIFKLVGGGVAMGVGMGVGMGRGRNAGRHAWPLQRNWGVRVRAGSEADGCANTTQ